MKQTVQARLDAEEHQSLRALADSLGWTPSQVVREGIRLVAAAHPLKNAPRLIGLGQFASGVSDLGSNKKHLEGLGKYGTEAS